MPRMTPMKLALGHQADFETAPLPEAAADAVQKERQDFPLVIATMPATERQRATAVGVVILLTVAAAAIAPFASIEVSRVDAFIPVLQTVVCVVHLVTATLLFAQFSIQPQGALLALASGYIFSGSFAFLQTLAFPGAYTPDGLIGELSPKVGDVGNREGGISWGCLTPPLLHRRSDMPCPKITSSS